MLCFQIKSSTTKSIFWNFLLKNELNTSKFSTCLVYVRHSDKNLLKKSVASKNVKMTTVPAPLRDLLGTNCNPFCCEWGIKEVLIFSIRPNLGFYEPVTRNTFIWRKVGFNGFFGGLQGSFAHVKYLTCLSLNFFVEAIKEN